MPEVSVILPNFNHAQYLKSRIESILTQSFQDFELLIFDDASTDESLEVIKSFSDSPKIKLVESNRENSGSTFIQWSKGFEKADGKYIWIAESDDLADPRFLETHLNVFKENPEVGLSFSASSWIDENGEIIHQPKHENSFKKPGFELLKNELGKGTFIYNASSCLFKKELIPWEKLDQMMKYKYCGDWLFWIGFAEKTVFARDSKRLNMFRRHNQNVSFKSETEGLQFSEGFQVLGYLLEKHEFSFTEKFKLLLHWTLKLQKSHLNNKRQFLAALPFPARWAYALSSVLVLLKLR
ncbi:glycosyltransferase family 2 protein [Jiulongibacter sediminis]|uniref:glycosyltransferase family 2 protein n=1 Tax=Jiulongibacter sediminis TaxID=1605367 RepID=UPI0006DCEF07|nr:glycosyltransferase [Jiulongibacter sediminis]